MSPATEIRRFDLANHPLNPGIHLLEASAGTGKTFSITGLIVRLLTEPPIGNVRPPAIGEILVVTFTRAATAELKDRISARLAATAEVYAKVALDGAGEDMVTDEMLRESEIDDPFLTTLLKRRQTRAEVKKAWQRLMTARANIDTAPISTIHSFCQRTLTANTVQTGNVGGRTIVENLSEMIELCVRDWIVNARHELDTMEEGLADEVLGLAKTAMPSRGPSDSLEKKLIHRVKSQLDAGPEPLVLPAASHDGLEQCLSPLSKFHEAVTMLNQDGKFLVQQEGALDRLTNLIQQCFSSEVKDGLGAVKLSVSLFDRGKKPTAPRIQDKSARGWAEYLARMEFYDAVPSELICHFWSLWTSGGPARVLLPGAQKSARYVDGEGNAATFIDKATPLLSDWDQSDVVRKVTALMEPYADVLNQDVKARVAADVAVLAVRQIAAQVQNELDRRFAMSSNSTIHELATALGPARDIDGAFATQLRSSFPVALIDEFQDTDNAQWDLFSRIYRRTSAVAEGTLFLIGDPKQAIYQFRGANVHTYLRAASASNPEYQVTLGTNYRSDKRYVDFMNRVMSGRDFFGRSGIDYIEVDAHFTERRTTRLHKGARVPVAPVHVVTLTSDDLPGSKEALRPLAWPAVVAQVLALKAADTRWHEGDADPEGRPLRWGDIAVLVNSNADGNSVVNALQRKNIPAMRWDNRSVYDTREAKEIHALLNALAHGDARSIRGFAASRLGGVTASQLASWDDDASLARERAQTQAETTAGLATRWLTWFADARQRLGSRALGDVLQSLLRQTGALQRLAAFEDGERALANLGQLIELVQDYAGVGQYQRDPLVVRDWLHGRITEAAGRKGDTDDTEQSRLDQELNSVAVLTIHKSKGLEFPVVILPGGDIDDAFSAMKQGKELQSLDPLAKSLLERKPVTIAKWPGSTTVTTKQNVELEHARWDSIVNDEDARERLRLLYVAVTRASRHLILFRLAKHRKSGKSGDPVTYLDLLFADEPIPAVAVLNSDDRFAAVSRGIETLRNAGYLDESEHNVDDGRVAAYTESKPDSASELTPQPAPDPHVDFRWKTGSFSSLQPPRVDDLDKARLAVDATPDAADNSETFAGLVGMFGGTRVGSFVHQIYELVDFAPLKPSHPQFVAARGQLEVTVAREAARSGFSPAGINVAAIADDLVRTLNEPLVNVASDFRLAALERSDRRDEVEFLLAGGRKDSMIDAQFVLEAIITSRSDLSHDYVEALRQKFQKSAEIGERLNAFHGFLTGFIDLVFRHDGRYWIVDYKTNTLHQRPSSLQATLDAYAPGRLNLAMQEHHYILQYHLYTVALHRWLALRVPGYAEEESGGYERHFGGILYPFVRGVAAASHARDAGLQVDAGHGVFYDRPAFGTIATINRLLRDGRRQEDCA
jgi:exodeoxyribonuclease V beta subunit